MIGSCVMSASACRYFSFSPLISTTTFYLLFQLIWISILLLIQSYQISFGMTTNEAANYRRYSYMIHPSDINAPAYRQRIKTPFDLGIIKNWINFCGGITAEFKNISWFSIYEVPATLERKINK